ncbi:Transcriptional activator FeaR [Klebsiella pneumoniae]|nr:Transcriptional activator FeaR [Klebsiella pneumoniae]
MMTTAEGGLAYQRWLATINQVCGHFAARPLEESFHGEIDARYAGSLGQYRHRRRRQSLPHAQ